MTFRRSSLLNRAVALALTWAIPGSTAWALTPPHFPAPLPPSSPTAAEPEWPAEAIAPISTSLGAPLLYENHDDDDDDDAVRPILECVVRHSSGAYTAYFGFKNETDQAVSIPVGSKNAFSPSPQNRNQPTSFPRGRSPYYPDAAFSVAFNGSNLTWSLKGPDNHTRTVTANSSSARCQSSPTPTPTPTATPTPIPTPTPGGICLAPILGARRFTRTCDDHGPTVYNQTFTIPAGSVGPYTLRVVNGDAQGRNKTSAAEVKINGIEVVRENDFSQNVTTFTRTIATLQPTNQLYVRVKSSPGSTFTLDICGASPMDTVPPAVEWLTPVAGSLSNDPTPLFRVRYSDLVSTPDVGTLKILVDGVDRTSLFNPQPDEASVDELIALGDGSHTVRAEIKDAAGNQGVGASTFRIDAQMPTLAIVTPSTGAVLSSTRPLVRITFADEGTQPSGLDPADFEVSIDAVSIAASLNRGAAEAAGQVPMALANGSHVLTATVADLAGNTSTRSSAFFVDTVPPVLTTSAPAAGQLVGANTAEVFVNYSDNQSLNLDSFTASVDGAPVGLTVDADTATGTTPTLPDGAHVLTFSIADRAGNTTTISTHFRTDTGSPEIAVTPLNGLFLNTASPEFRVTFSDPQGIAPGSLKVLVDGVDRTAAFLPLFAADEARAILPGPLGEGVHTVVAEIRDRAGNPGAVTSSFTIDLTPPVLTVAEPLSSARLKDATPTLSIRMSDSQTGIEPTATSILLDGMNVIGSLAVAPEAITGTLTTPLAEGAHVLRVTVVDRAQNPTTVDVPFFVDLTPPTLEMASPLPNGFTNDATPEIWLRAADSLGESPSGVDAASIRVWLLSQDPLLGDTDITALLNVGPADTRGEFVAALPNGSHRLRAVASDLAGNESEITVGFVVDTVAPTLEIDQPQTSTFVNSGAPTIVLLYGDDRSGINAALTQLRVDGVERASSLVLTPTGAAVTLLDALGLDDGPHTIEARVIDLAGNAAEATPVSFGVDTVTPLVSITAPGPGVVLSAPTIAVAASFSDPDADGLLGSAAGIDAESTRGYVDGIDRTSEFTFGPLTATAAIATLASGVHTIRIEVKDRASNTASATASFVVDADPPQITIDGAEAVVVGAAALVGGRYRIAGSAVDADPALTVACAIGSAFWAGTVSAGRFECDVSLSSGVNVITVTARDSGGREVSATRTVTFDQTSPVITILSPAGAAVTAASTFDVAVRVADDTAVEVSIGGVAASPVVCVGSAPAVCDYNASVPLGAGPLQQIVVEANDAAQNQAQQIATIVIDRNAPRVTITRPAPGVVVRPGLVALEVVVLDETPTTLSITGSNQPMAPSSCAPEGADLRCVFESEEPVAEGQNDIAVSARDAAGNESVAHAVALADGAPPTLTIASPASLAAEPPQPPYVTKAITLALTGRVLDASAVSLSLDGVAVPVAQDGSFGVDLPLPAEGSVTFALLARDAAGNETVLTRSLLVDRTAPVLLIVSPASGTTLSVANTIVQGTVVDASAVSITVDGSPATVVGGAFQFTLSDLQDGSRTIIVVATDAAGNTASASRTVEVDLAPPTLAITSPTNGTLTREPSADVALSVNDRGATTIRQGGLLVLSCAGGTCAQAVNVQLAEGDNTFTFEATDIGGRTAQASVTITRDSTPPTIDLSTPLTVSRTRSGSVGALATDAVGVASVVVTLVQTGATLCAGTGACQLALLAPASSTPGMSLTIRAVATDVAGNTATTERSVRVIGEGAVAGQTLNDRTSLPLNDVSVSVVAGGTAPPVTTDSRGRYSLPARNAAVTLRLERTGYTSVERNVAIEALTGTVPVDARLTPLRQIATSSGAEPIVLTPRVETDWLGFSLTAPAGDLSFTPLSSQGLPNLLPAGFAPLAAFEIATSLPGPFVLNVSGMRPSAVAHLARYSFELHDWRLVTTPVAVLSGSATVDLPEPGSYALVVADETGATSAPVVIPAAGDAFLGLPTALIPSTATSEGAVNPAVLSPAGGVATGTLRIAAPATSALPSGTIVQAEVTEEYTLTAGSPATEEKRTMDIVLYRAPVIPATPSGPASTLPCAFVAAAGAEGNTDLCATFPISPSRTYTTADLVEGRVHLDILAGREGARGMVGGSEALTLNDGGIDFVVAAGSTAEDVAMEISAPAAVSSFAPSDDTTTSLSEIVIDLFGVTLSQSAVLRFPLESVAATGTLVVGRLVRTQDGAASTGTTEGGTPRFEIVSMAEVVGDHIETRPGFGLPGIKQEGRYVLFLLGSPVGFLSGIATAAANGEPVRAVLVTEGLPFVAIAGADGRFVIPALARSTRLSASVPGTSLAGEVTALVSAAAVAAQNVALAGVVSQAAFSVPNGATKVEINQTFSLVSPVPLKASTVNTASITLLKITPGNPPVSAPVDIRLLLSGSGKRVSIVAIDPLSFDTQYTLQASGLVDTVDGLVTAAPATFRTKDDTPPFYDPRRLKIGLPNAQGLAPITASGCWPAPGCFYPGTTALIINTANGMVVTLSAGNNGEFNSDILAKTSDRLVITITDPFGNQTTFQKSEFVDETTGETGIGAGGGRVAAVNPTNDPETAAMELNVPEGAFPEGAAVKLKISKATRAEAMPQEPDLPGFHFGSAIRIESEGWDAPLPEGREIDISFPRPDFSVLPESERPSKPEDVHYWVIRKMVKEDGTVMYETLDYADPDPASGAGLSGSRIKTASFPFVGLASPASTASLGGFLGPVLLGAVAVQHVILMWYVDKLTPARATQGVLNGRVFRQVYKAGQAESSTEGIAAVLVSEAEVIPGSNPVQYRLLAAEATATGPVVATTQGSGMFTGIIPRFDAGQKLYGANVGGVVYVGSTYQVVRNDSKTQSSPQLLNLFNAGFSNNVAYVDINLPAVTAPPAAPQIDIRLLDISSTPRRALSNVVIAGEPVRFGFRTRSLTSTPDPTPGVNRADITGPSGTSSITLQVDPLKASSPTSPLAYDQISNDDFVPGTPGTYTITAVRTPAFGPPIQETYTFRAISPGGSIKTSVPGRPGVLADQTKPRRDGRGQPITVAPQLVFSEPVTNVPGNVKLKDAAGNVVPVRISAIALDVNGDDIVIPDLQSSTAKVTGLTLEPLANLRYGNTYTLSLTEAIVDLDTPEAQALIPYSTSFTTFSPEELGGSETKPIVAGIAVLGDRAYAAETNYAGGIGGASQSGNLVTFDVTDPSLPVQVDPKVAIPFPPRDIAAEETMVDGTDASGQPTQVSRRTVAVVAQPRTYYKVEGELVFYTSIVSSPSNLFVYDVTDPSIAPKWVGAASISANLDDGTPSRMKVKGNKAYVGMFGRGIVVAELDQAKNGFSGGEAPAVGTPARRDLDLALNQGGVNRSAAGMVVKIVDPALGSATDPRVDNAPASRSLPVIDLDVADMVVNGSVQRIVLATSMRREAALILATGTDPYPLVRRAIPGMLVSSAVALTKVDGHDLAIVGGFKDGKWGIATIDLSPLAAPISTNQQPPELPMLWFTEIPDLTGIGDIEMLGTTAVVTSQVGVGKATLIDINVATPPVISGTIDGVASRVAVSDKVLFSADGRVFVPGAGTADALHGVKAAALDVTPVIKPLSPEPFGVDHLERSQVPVDLKFSVVTGGVEVESARAELLKDGQAVEEIPLARSGSTWTGRFAKGKLFQPASDYYLRFVANPGPEEKASRLKRVRPAQLEFTLTAESEDDERLDLLKLFNPSPSLSVEPMQLGAGRRFQTNVRGEVRSVLNPVSQVAVSGRAYPVSQTSTGPNGAGPFVGTFNVPVELGPETTRIGVHALNALANLASYQLTIKPTLLDGLVIGRTVASASSISPWHADTPGYQFRLQLRDRGATGSSIDVVVDTGVEQKIVRLRGSGGLFVSAPLLAVPENLALPESSPEALKSSLLRVKLGVKPRVLYATNVHEEAAITGALLVDSDSGLPVDAASPSGGLSARQRLGIRVGASGTAGAQLSVPVAGLREDLSLASGSSSAPFVQTLTLQRQSSNPKSSGYNLYVSSESIVPVVGATGPNRPGTREVGVIGGAFIRLTAPTGDSYEPIGIAAEQASWLVEQLTPVFQSGEERPRFFDVVVSAEVSSSQGAVPALPLDMFFDLRTDPVEDISSVTNVIPSGDDYVAAEAMQTSDNGRVYLKVRLDVRPSSVPNRTKAFGLQTVDMGGASVVALLKTLAIGAPVPVLVLDALRRAGGNPLLAPFAAGRTSASLPQSVEALMGLVIRELYEPTIRDLPGFGGFVDEVLERYGQAGIALSRPRAEELTVNLLLGFGLGVPLGASQAAVDDLNVIAQVRDLSTLVYYSFMGSLAFARVKWRIQAGVIQFIADPAFRAELIDRYNKGSASIRKIISVVGNREVLTAIGVRGMGAIYDSYETKVAAYLPALGILRDNDDERTFILGFAAGHITGYVAEIAATFVIAVPTGIGLAVAGMVKVGRIGKAARALSILRKVRVAELRAVGETTTIAAGVLDWFHFLQKIPEGKLVSILSDPALNGKEEIILRAVMEYADDSDAIVDGERVVPGIVKLGEALGNADEPAETLLTLARLWEHPRLTTLGASSPGITFSVDASEFAIKGVDRLAKALREGKLSRGFLDRIISALDSGGADTALGKIHNTVDAFDGNLNRGLALEYFFKALSGPQWDGATFAQLERLAQRWATALPPPAADEAYFDIVVTIGKYGRNAEANTPGTAAAKSAAASEATARIVKQLDRITDDAGDVLKQLVLLDKTYGKDGTVYAALTKVDLDWLARNMEANRFVGETARTPTAIVEEITRTTRIVGEYDEVENINVGGALWRQLQAAATEGPDQNVIGILKGTLANMEVGDAARAAGASGVSSEVGAGNSALDTLGTASSDLHLQFQRAELVNGQVVISQGVTVRAGRFAIETKAYILSVWRSKRYSKVTEQVGNGFQEVDPGRRGQGQSWVATTPDILDDLEVLRGLLVAVNQQTAEEWSNRTAVIILARPSQGPSSYANFAAEVIRSLVP